MGNFCCGERVTKECIAALKQRYESFKGIVACDGSCYDKNGRECSFCKEQGDIAGQNRA